MKVEVLYVTDCPSHYAAVQMVESILNSEGITARVHQILVENQHMANKLRFCGSPTIRINGSDVVGEPPRANFGLSCRLYPGSPGKTLPSTEMVRLAITKAHEGGES